MFYTSCLEALYKPGRCGDGCTAATLNCRLAELNQACCSQPGACAAGSLVPAECSVECALIAVPFVAECTPLLGLDNTALGALRNFASACTDQDLTDIVEYGYDLFSQGCSIEFGVAPEASGGGWVTLTTEQIAAASCQRIAGEVSHVVVNPSGRLDFVDFQESADHSGVLRCDIVVPVPFTKVRGSCKCSFSLCIFVASRSGWTDAVNPVVPSTADQDDGQAGHNHHPGDPTDPDNNYEIVNWGDDPPGHAGSFVLGTEHDIVDRGSQMGTNTASFTEMTTITIPETTVTRSSVVRLEMCQSADHEDFQLEQISIQIFTDASSSGNLVVGGGFEQPVCQAWNYGGTCRPEQVVAAPQAPPGWAVTQGDVDCECSNGRLGLWLLREALTVDRCCAQGANTRRRVIARPTAPTKVFKCWIRAAARPAGSSRRSRALPAALSTCCPSRCRPTKGAGTDER